MNNKKFNTAEYRNQLQEQFSGMDGWDSMDGGISPEMNFEGDPAMNAVGGQLGGAVPIEAPELNFTITNSSTTANATAVLFGASLFLTDTYFGSSSTITITPDFNVPYVQVLRDTSTSPFTVGMVRMQCSANAAQVTQNLSVVSTNIYGSSKTDPINMVTQVSEYQYNNTIARSAKPFDITSDVYFSFTVLPSTTLTCTVYVKNKVNVARQLDGRPISGQYLAPNTGIKPVMINTQGGLRQLGK